MRAARSPVSTRQGRRALVIAQVALAVLVVAMAAGLIRSVLRLQSLDMGMAADRLVVVPLSIPTAVSAIESATCSCSRH